MIEIRECSKSFGSVKAVQNVSMDIGEREVFGLVGSNGAGKSTLLRMTAGVMKPDHGEIHIDGIPVFDNKEAKSNLFYLSDDSYFPANNTPSDMADYISLFYPGFEKQRFSKLLRQFQLKEDRKISTFSKGMKKQLQILLGISAGTKYLLCDETFDGLDPVMRQGIKSLFATEILNREFTPVLASHSLRELEDICDHVGLLYQGGMLLSKNLEDMKFHIYKIQCVLPDNEQEKVLEKELDILKLEHQGSLVVFTARGTRTEIMEKVQEKNPLFCEVLPLSLEEIFISETEVAGYEIRNLFF
nr:ABC transporter ATP-binding protein [uncultured Blautia sp.]